MLYMHAAHIIRLRLITAVYSMRDSVTTYSAFEISSKRATVNECNFNAIGLQLVAFIISKQLAALQT